MRYWTGAKHRNRKVFTGSDPVVFDKHCDSVLNALSRISGISDARKEYKLALDSGNNSLADVIEKLGKKLKKALDTTQSGI